MSHRGRLLCVATVVTACALSGCSDDRATRVATPTPPSAATSSTSRPTTTSTIAPPPVTLPATDITAATAAISTTIGLPQPAPAPLDARADEPHVELGTIEIPAIGLDATLLEGVRLTTLDHGPGHWPGTAMPGELGNVVVAGHRTSKDRPFRYLDRLVPGDEVVFTTDAGRFTYVVTGADIVTPDAVWIVDQTAEHRATLFACHPPGSVSERIVVHLALTGGTATA